MPWRVEERDLISFVIDCVGTDVLSDSTRLTRSNTRFTDRIHERCLAMIDMPHERDDGTPRLEFLFLLDARRWRRDYDLFDLVNTCAFFTALFF